MPAATTGRPRTNELATFTTSSGFPTRSRTYDPRGNSGDRRARKNWMLTSPQFHRRPGTEGVNVNCTHCGTELNYNTVEADRINPSGGYRRANVQPSCRDCNIRRANNINWVHPSRLGK